MRRSTLLKKSLHTPQNLTIPDSRNCSEETISQSSSEIPPLKQNNIQPAVLQRRDVQNIDNFFDSDFAKSYNRSTNLTNPFTIKTEILLTKLNDISTSFSIEHAIEKINRFFCAFDVICLAAAGYNAINKYLSYYSIDSITLKKMKNISAEFESDFLRDAFLEKLHETQDWQE